MASTTQRHGSARRLLLALALGLGILSAFSQPGSAYASLLVGERPATASLDAETIAFLAPPSAGLSTQQPHEPAAQHTMPYRATAGQDNDGAARRAFVTSVIVGMFASRWRR